MRKSIQFIFKVALLSCALGAGAGTPANAQGSSSFSQVEAWYATRASPLWFAGAVPTPAANALPAILKRAQLDGLADGPGLAALVETAIQTASRYPGGALEMDRLLSNAWVRYVQALQAPMPGFDYADERMKRTPDSAAFILKRAADSQSQLLGHMLKVAAVNPIYSELRDAVWNASQLSGSPPSPAALANLARVRVLAPEGKAIIVDVRAAKLYMIEQGRIVDSMRVVVGKPATQTPMLASTIYYATFNPYWNVPQELVRQLVAPRVVAQGLTYLTAHDYDVVTKYGSGGTSLPPRSVDWKAVAEGRAQARVRQSPGPMNSMGRMKFGIANSEGIYLHDTPNKAPFAEDNRLLSNGCIRLEDAQRLGRWLLERDPQGQSAASDDHVLLPNGVPIYVTYLTLRTEHGMPKSLSDSYGRDLSEDGRALARR